jgi:hypothetical protein
MSRRVLDLSCFTQTVVWLANDQYELPSPCRVHSQRRISMAISSWRPTSEVR